MGESTDHLYHRIDQPVIAYSILLIFRKLDEAELENFVLRDPNSRCNRMRQLGLATVGTSGHFINQPTHTSLLACVKIINEGDFGSSVRRCLGSGRFGVCYLRTLGHFSVCEKFLKRTNDAMMEETNLLSKFCHRCLPYLFGVRIDDNPSIITSFHGLKDHSVTIHHALFTQSQDVRRLLIDIDWINVLGEVICGFGVFTQ